MKTMTPRHPLWKKFAERLDGPEGCNFKDINGKFTWSCKGGMDKSKAKAILESMADIDVEKSLAYFDEHGGHCDCEILFNVDK
jgi:hypothetical protein